MQTFCDRNQQVLICLESCWTGNAAQGSQTWQALLTSMAVTCQLINCSNTQGTHQLTAGCAAFCTAPQQRIEAACKQVATAQQ